MGPAIIATGSLGRMIAEGARKSGMADSHIHTTADADEAGAIARTLVQKGDVVLVKGSRAMKMEQVVDAFTKN